MAETAKQHLGRYEILAPIGHGAHATVYKARDPALDRIVALKVMRPGLLWDPDAVERFLREAKAAAQLEHPHIVTIYEVGEAEGTYFIAMRYLPGLTVDALIEQGPLPAEKAVDIARQVAEALGYAHERGFIHRDVKPGNIIVSDDGFATLTDFGLVKALEWASLTSSGGAIGTPGYVAPEIWEEQGASPATDVYALGVVLWEMLAGRRLFEGETPAGVMRKHLTTVPPPLEVQADISKAIAKVVAKALEKTPEDRYQNGADFAQALAQATSTQDGLQASDQQAVLEQQRDWQDIDEVYRQPADPIANSTDDGLGGSIGAGALATASLGLIALAILIWFAYPRFSGTSQPTTQKATGTVIAELITATPLPIITATPVPTQTVSEFPTEVPTIEPTIPTRVGVGAYVRVAGTGGFGLRLRSGPGTGYVTWRIAPEGEILLVTGGPQEADGLVWWRVVDQTGLVGWLPGEQYLVPVEPPAWTPEPERTPDIRQMTPGKP